MKQIFFISFLVFFIGLSVWAQTVVESQTEPLQPGEDPCVIQVQKTIQSTDHFEETGVDEYADAKGISELSKSKLFGRFFKTTVVRGSSSKTRLYWTIPYAQGQACVIRDVKRL